MIDDSKPRLSVIVLCYRAEKHAPVFAQRVLEELQEHNISFELILVANYFPQHEDITPAIVRKYAEKDKRIRVVSLKKEGMFGWDVRSGLAAANGEYIMFLDGDGQIAPKNIIGVYETAIMGEYDMVQAYRRKRNDGIIRVVVSKTFNKLSRILFPKIRVRDINAKPKLFSRKSLTNLKLLSDNWFVDTEMTIQAAYKGFKITEIPINFLANDNRRSFVRSKDVLDFLKDLFVYRYKTLKDKELLYENRHHRRRYGWPWGSIRTTEKGTQHNNI